MININIEQEYFNDIYGYLDIVENINDDMYYAIDDEERKYVLTRYNTARKELYKYISCKILMPYLHNKYINYIKGNKIYYMRVENIDINENIIQMYGYGFYIKETEYTYNTNICIKLNISINNRTIHISYGKYDVIDIINEDTYNKNIENFIKVLK